MSTKGSWWVAVCVKVAFLAKIGSRTGDDREVVEDTPHMVVRGVCSATFIAGGRC